MPNARVLVIPDMHHPYAHADTIPFLRAIKSKYRPDKVICLGDEIDWHAISFHTHDPDLMSPGDELQTAIARLKPLYKLFPKVEVLESNHGSLVYRKGKHHGLPRNIFKSFREVIEAPKGWKWYFDLTIRLSNGTLCYFHHGKSSSGLKLSQAMGMCTAQGHFHEKFCIEYWANPNGLYWSLQSACLIDWHTMAFEYAANNVKRPLIGASMILDGHPKLIPMILDKNGRWIKRLL